MSTPTQLKNEQLLQAYDCFEGTRRPDGLFIDSNTISSGTENESPRAVDEVLERANEGDIIAPDGGWGWMIIVAVFMVNFIVDGVIGCYGLIFPDLMRKFSSSPALTSMAGSLIVGTYMCSCLLVGGLIRRFGCRTVSVTGGIIGAVGCCSCMFSQNLVTFMFLYGVIGGIGFGMNSLPGHIAINSYFNRKRGLANGIAFSGAGVGVFLMAPLIQFTLSEYGWSGTMLINGGIILNFCVCGALLRPLSSKKYSPLADKAVKRLNVSKKKDSCDNDDTTGEQSKSATPDHLPLPDGSAPLICKRSISLKPFKFARSNGFLTPEFQRRTKGFSNSNLENIIKNNLDVSSLPDLKNLHHNSMDHKNVNYRKNTIHFLNDPFKRKDIFYSGNLYHLKEFNESMNMEDFIGSMTICDRSEEENSSIEEGTISCIKDVKILLRQLCDITVFKNRFFIPVLVGAIGVQMSQFIPNTFIAAYCHTVDLQDAHISVIVSLYGVFNILGRISAGCLANLSCINTLWLFNFGVFMCGVACAVFPLCTTFLSLSIFSAGLGYFMGYFPPLQILVLVEYIGIEKLTASLGFVQLFKGFSAVAGPPLAGMVYEWTKSYGMAVQFAAVLSFLAAFAQSLVPIIDKCTKNKSGKQREIEISSPETENILTCDL